MRDTLYLVKNGVEWNEAWNMTAEQRKACYIVMAELNGEKYNWDEGRFYTLEELGRMKDDS